jgi:glucose/mannose-6-phosphate isomerase
MGGFAKLQRLHQTLDPDDMLGLVSSFPTQMEDAWQRGADFTGSVTLGPAQKVVVFGMGGSAIGGDMVRSFLGDRLEVPLHVNRHYAVPPSLLTDALLVFSSYSGNTGETLTAFDSAIGKGAAAVAITSGGLLEGRCREHGVPVCKIPGGRPPRSAIAYSFMPLLRILAAAGVAPRDENEYLEARTALEELCVRYTSDSPQNRAADLAFELVGNLPLIYSAGDLLDAVGRRWSCQFNENGKSLAHYGAFPEINHNEIVGWTALEQVRKKMVVVSLEDREDHPMARAQAEIALDIIEPNAGGVVRIQDLTGQRMQRILSAMILGDFVSVYLAYLNGVDPTPVANIDFLKKRLAERG